MLNIPRLGYTDILGEARVLGEYLRFRGDEMVEDHRAATSGNWRPVLLIPGFLAGDATLYPLGARLRAHGHRVYYSGIWMNADCPRKTLDRLDKRLHDISLMTGRKAVVIGHSLGGVYARELARQNPDLVERVFLLGSPIRHTMGNATPYLRPFIAAMRMMHGRCMESVGTPCAKCGLDLPEEAPDVQETVIYTKTDGVVEYHSCLDTGAKVECLEVDSSHCGLPLNLKTWEIIHDRLATPIEVTNPTRLRIDAAATRPSKVAHRPRPGYLKLVRRDANAGSAA